MNMMMQKTALAVALGLAGRERCVAAGGKNALMA